MVTSKFDRLRELFWQVWQAEGEIKKILGDDSIDVPVNWNEAIDDKKKPCGCARRGRAKKSCTICSGEDDPEPPEASLNEPDDVEDQEDDERPLKTFRCVSCLSKQKSREPIENLKCQDKMCVRSQLVEVNQL